MNEKVLISLIAVALGWLLGQGTALAKDWWAARKLRKGLLVELEDIQDQLQRVVMIHSRHLQIFAINGMEPASSLPIHNMFFSQYFKETFSHLNREQRISYQLIHASLESLNQKTDDLTKYLGDFYKEHRKAPNPAVTKAAIDIWGDQVIAIYKTAMDVRWHIAYHLRHPEAPSFDIMGPMHESYVKFEQELDDEVKKIMEGAKGLKPEDFMKIYDPKIFAQSRSAS